MNFPLQLPTTLESGISASLFLLLIIWISLIVYKNRGNNNSVPQAPGAWPIIGHLHLFGGAQPAHITLANMVDKYGPIFNIKLGVHPTLVISSWDIAKEIYTTHDKVFLSRPKSLGSKLLGYDFAMFGVSPYGPYWGEMRKIAIVEVLSNRRIEALKHVRQSEVKACIGEIHELWVKSKDSAGKVNVEMKRWFGDVSLNVLFRTVVGKRYVEAVKSNDKLRVELRNIFVLMGVFPLGDAIPFLRWLDIGGYEKAMKKAAKQTDICAQEWLEEHRQKRLSSHQNKVEQEDFMDAMISIVDSAQELPSYDADAIIKATCLALILAGSDTTTASLTWVLSLLVNNPECLKKAQEELDRAIGKERQVQESDLNNLPYLHAIVKETLRLYPAGPLSVPRESLEDCVVAGYHVPAGTRLLVNLSKLQRDALVWHDPNEFRPERFLTTHEDIDVRGQNYELLPFGSGRRVCPGISFSLLVMHLTLANLLHGFEITTPSNRGTDMTESIGLSNLKVKPLDVLIEPRLPHHLY